MTVLCCGGMGAVIPAVLEERARIEHTEILRDVLFPFLSLSAFGHPSIRHNIFHVDINTFYATIMVEKRVK